MNTQRFGILIRPSANRVYAESSVALMEAELEVLDRAVLGGRVRDVASRTIGGVPYLTFSADDLSARDVAFLSNLSSLYALFRLGEGTALHPVELSPLDRLDDDLLTIQKYAGKTNEYFTKLLLNVTLWSSDSGPHMTDRRLRVLDPMCGRGTTLNQAMMYGYDADGVDIDGKDFDAYAGFLRTWLKRKRLKHTAETSPVRRDRRLVGRRFDVSYGLSKEEYKAGDRRRLAVINADTLRAADFFAAESFDVIVTDAPYGVQHGARTREALTRSPLELLTGALPGWVRLLRQGGAVGISWNTFVTGREEAVKALASAGLEPLDEGPYLKFRHRVDQAIVRDVIVARKP
ncbi:TRM11 family SAM-dependent methyltransferase [Actinocorallia populi]|uniref:TRM11 family SAM-dependent methyltransferase n=1 Tax=Actinocorallia populi TaxID=2079200 RepID=UPI001E529F75|nr:SAM-dependent methyltransferase [Actinocorallia populi]